MADIASNTPVTEDTVFRIGSITKTFTAIAVMQLWEQGLVDLDAPANDYLRAYRLIPAKASWRPATVRHLLTHTAGVPEWLHPSRMVCSALVRGELRAGRAPADAGGVLPRRLCAWPSSRAPSAPTPTTASPRSARSSRTSAAQPLDRYLREHIFEPLGMADTAICSAPIGSRPGWRRATPGLQGRESA